MPQVFQVLRCYKCFVFQVHQRKKSIKWECKLCGEKQSLKRHYAIGTAKDCRHHVQKLNTINGESREAIEANAAAAEDVSTDDGEVSPPEPKKSKWNKKTKAPSKWKSYVEEEEPVEQDNKTEYLGNAEVILEKNKKVTKWKPPSQAQNNPQSSILVNHNQQAEWVSLEEKYWNDRNIDNDNHGFKTGAEYHCMQQTHKPVENRNTLINIGEKQLNIQPNPHTTKSISETSLTKNKNSKWADYINEEEDSSQSQTEVLKEQKGANIMFESDDANLDDLLNF